MDVIPLFRPGMLVATPGALDALARAGQAPEDLLILHLLGDWGEVCERDWEANDDAVANSGRILSAYDLAEEVRVWIITEADRASTTLLLPCEY